MRMNGVILLVFVQIAFLYVLPFNHLQPDDFNVAIHQLKTDVVIDIDHLKHLILTLLLVMRDLLVMLIWILIRICTQKIIVILSIYCLTSSLNKLLGIKINIYFPPYILMPEVSLKNLIILLTTLIYWTFSFM